MQGLVFDIRSFSVHDGPGIRTTVFFKGCPLRCLWCHNPESQHDQPALWNCIQSTGNITVNKTEVVGKYMSAEDVMFQVLKDVPFFDESGGGITLSGGEPLLQPEFTLKLLYECQKKGIHTAVDTSGFAPAKDFRHIMPYTSLFLFDLKIVSSHVHKKFTGKDNKIILDNLRMLYRSGNEIILRIPLIQDITDTPENLEGLMNIIGELPDIRRIDLLPFHNIARHKFEKLGMENVFKEHANYSRDKVMEVLDLFNSLNRLITIGG